VKLKTLKLTNFRSYENFSIDSDEKLNVIVAENGIGKLCWMNIKINLNL
jgi:recombinational DNA repair ATPase RecF